jgi:hypothetical protein
MNGRNSLVVAVAVALAFVSCSGHDDSSNGAAASTSTAAASRHPNLQWKRYSALEADLMQALDLPADQLCNEFGLDSCINSVHLAPLGGNEPFKTGLLEPTADPLATTPAVVDRVVLSACSRRADIDKGAPKNAAVFRNLDLGGPSPAPDDAQVKETVTELYHRFLARDPTDDERAVVAGLARDEKGKPLAASEFATLACYAVGSSTEFLFY